MKQVGAIYLFDVKEKGKYFVDFKNGSGAVGVGEYLHFLFTLFVYFYLFKEGDKRSRHVAFFTTI